MMDESCEVSWQAGMTYFTCLAPCPRQLQLSAWHNLVSPDKGLGSQQRDFPDYTDLLKVLGVRWGGAVLMQKGQPTKRGTILVPPWIGGHGLYKRLNEYKTGTQEETEPQTVSLQGFCLRFLLWITLLTFLHHGLWLGSLSWNEPFLPLNYCWPWHVS